MPPSGPRVGPAGLPIPPAIRPVVQGSTGGLAGATTQPPASAPPQPPEPAARPSAPRPINPFLSQDPAAKARRLARALISDMVVYHPAKRQEGLREGTLKDLFDEEIRKSWEEYSEQVGKEVAESTSYFKEALNEILADGREIF
jgi:hypothetical protein